MLVGPVEFFKVFFFFFNVLSLHKSLVMSFQDTASTPQVPMFQKLRDTVTQS